MTAHSGCRAAASVLAVAAAAGHERVAAAPGGLAAPARPRRPAIILGCAAPALAVLAPYLQHRLWPVAAIIAVGYGGFFLIRTRQLRRADRDGVRRLLGLHKNASYGEVLSRPSGSSRAADHRRPLVLAVGAAGVIVAGVAVRPLRRSPLIALLLGAARRPSSAAYWRALAKQGARDRPLTAGGGVRPETSRPLVMFPDFVTNHPVLVSLVTTSGRVERCMHG